MELMRCPGLAVPPDVMQHVVNVESSFNPYAIGVVGGRLVRQPANLPEAVATARMLESRGYNFSLGLAQVNRYNLARYGLDSYEAAFQACPNLQAGARILADCHARSGQDWGKAFSCYYSGNFTAGFRAGYVQKIFASMRGDAMQAASYPAAIEVIGTPTRRAVAASPAAASEHRDGRTAFAARREPVSPYAPSVAAISPRGDRSDTRDAAAVLQPAGRAPSLVQVQDVATRTAPDAPASSAPARDAAFVF